MDRCSVVIALHGAMTTIEVLSLLFSLFSFCAFSNCAMFDFPIGFTSVQSIDNDVILRLSWQKPFIVRDFTIYILSIQSKYYFHIASNANGQVAYRYINEPPHNRKMSSITFTLLSFAVEHTSRTHSSDRNAK